MDTLATVKDLDSYGIEYADEKLAGKLLESVSAAVRDAAGCPITRGEYTVTIPGETSRRLDLPMRPVISVSRVLMDGEQTGDWKTPATPCTGKACGACRTWSPAAHHRHHARRL